jgi:hypothetical protein
LNPAPAALRAALGPSGHPFGGGRHAAPLVRNLPHDQTGSPVQHRPPLGACLAITDLALCAKDHVCNNQQKVSNGSQDVTISDASYRFLNLNVYLSGIIFIIAATGAQMVPRKEAKGDGATTA